MLVLLALVAGVEPASAKHGGCFFVAIPVAGENIRTANDDFVFFADLHLDAVDGRPDVSGVDGSIGIVHRADAGRFGESVDLEHANAEHAEKVLSFWSQRRRAADQRAEIRPEAFLDLRKDERPAKR